MKIRCKLLLASIAALLFTLPLPAQDATELLNRMKAMEERIKSLEAEVQALKSQQTAAAVPQAAPAQPVPMPVAAAQPLPQDTTPLGGAGGAAAKALNPDISVIGDFLGAIGNPAGRPTPSLEMHETEVAFQEVIDPYARADFFISFGEQGVTLEEGYITFTSLPAGLQLKVGKMRAAFGKVNTLHNHVMPWTDRPLVTTNLVGGEDGIDDTGFSVARLIPNKLIFLEATGQAFEGTSGNGLYTSSQRSDLTYVGHLRAYKDITDNTNLDFGFSISHGHNNSGVVDGDDVGRFTTQLYGGDATIRWKPLQRSVYHSFVGRSEFVWSSRNQPSGTQDAKGFFVSADYQLARRWYVGGRYDRSGRPDAASVTDSGQSLILSYFPSEFSQIRGQYRRTDYGVGPTANEFLFQFQFAIGAHGAHPF